MRTFRRIGEGGLRLALVTLLAPAVGAGVVINEVHYDPDVKTDLAEFIELYNPGPAAVDLNGWSITDAVEYRFTNTVVLPTGGFVLVAQDPATVRSKYGAAALGPWIGLLANEGETITLRDATGQKVDEVDYQLGFPWPNVGEAPGYSIELVNPAFDNDLGGNWRASVAGDPTQQSQTLIPAGSLWSYFKGFSEASTPVTEWRRAGFDDTGWPTGAMPIGYGEGFIVSPLDDMQYNYTTVFFRASFVVSNVAEISELVLEAMYDDGFKVWINTTNVLNANMPTGDVPFDGVSGPFREDYSYHPMVISSPGAFLRAGTNVIAIQGANVNLTNSSDFFLDVRLTATIGPSGHGPTPGRLNSVYATNLPPAIRQVEHRPKQPASGEPVRLTAKITDPDGVSGATVLYQRVDPGNYIELTDAAYASDWTSVPMNDAGVDGDEFAGDSVYTALIPAPVQTHRRLVRYRITAADDGGRSLTVPYPDDPQPNFAYFVYDGVPAWRGAVQPGSTPAMDFGTNVMRRLPVIHLLAKRSVVEEATWFSGYGGDLYLWAGTLVYDGDVYDHIHYRARGGVWRYSMVKNMWKFDFQRGHDLQMQDDYGRKYRTRWTKLNLGACIQQGDYWHRGEQGMFESVGFRLFNLAGVPSPKTTFVQFRVVDDVLEADPGTQYDGDFWGVYLAVEQEDGRFLDEHGLPDGNFYKMEGGTGDANNLGPLGPADKSDLNAFLSTYRSTSPLPTDDWWRTNLNLPAYFSYQAIVQGIHHYDICYDKNYFYYRHPETGTWSVHTWDLDLTWANNMFDSGCGGIDDLYQPLIGGGGYPSRPGMVLEYRNRVREIRDLLLNPEQAGQLIDEYAARLRGTLTGPTILDADRCMWDWNPKMASSTYTPHLNKAGQGRFYAWPEEPSVTRDFNGCIQLMKNYVQVRGAFLDNLAGDNAIPTRPSVAYTGPAAYPVNQLRFRSSDYSGQNAFAAMRWRVAEVTDPTAPAYNPAAPGYYEIEADWDSGDLSPFASDLQIPPGIAKVGHAYRVRVRMKDVTGRWSRWSPAVQFVATEPDNAAALLDHLRLTELMYDPPGDSEEFEFIELFNTSTNLDLKLDGVKFTAGIDFTFPLATTLPAGGCMVLTRTTNVAALRAHYGLGPGVAVVGGYSGGLANNGEQIVLKTSGAGTEIVSFDYNNGRGWPVAAAGAGHSLVPQDRALATQATGALDYPGNWRASAFMGGSPGYADPAPPAPALVLNEIVAHTDYANPQRPEYDSNDWIELLSQASVSVVPGTWFLSDDPGNLRKSALPTMAVEPGTHLTFDEVSGFHSPVTAGFGLDKAGELVLLSYLPGTTEDRVVDAVRFKGQENDRSWERFPDGGEFWYPALRSSNTVNLVPAGSVILNEIMYHPISADGTNDSVLDEYLEVLNPTPVPVSLFTTNGAWRLDGGARFDVPANTTLPPGGLLVLVGFDPAVGTNLAWFRSLYGLTNPAVPILGPYSGKLGNRSDRLAIERPQFPDLPGDPYSWVIVDEVIYGNQNPWPTAAHGTGSALHRIAPDRSGNDPANWIAAAPSPGAVAGANPDRDRDGMPNDWEERYLLDPDSASDAVLDTDLDGLTNLQEYLAGTDPRDPASVLRFESVRAAGTRTTLSFRAAAGKFYSLEVRDTLATGTWRKLQDVVADPLPRLLEIEDLVPADVPERYYRIVAPATP